MPLRSKKPGNKTAKIKRKRLAVLCCATLAMVGAPFLAFYLRNYRANIRVDSGQLAEYAQLNSSDRILVLSPHPDDETLGVAGLLARAAARGIPVRVVYLTNGDGSHSTQLYKNTRHPFQYPSSGETYIKLAAMRQAEALLSLEQLGLAQENARFLGYPDGGVRALWLRHWEEAAPYVSPYTGKSASPYSNSPTPGAPYAGKAVLADVVRQMREFRPTLVWTTHPADTHPDHHTAYDLCATALQQLKAENAAGSAKLSWVSSCRLESFLVHHGPWPVPSGYHPARAMVPPAALLRLATHWFSARLSEEERARKLSALEAYGSQLATTPRYLRAFVRSNELLGTHETQDVVPGGPAQDAVLDPDNDVLLGTFVPGGDIEALSVHLDNAGRPALALRLTSAPSPRVTYTLAWHTVTRNGVAAPLVVSLAFNDGSWQASLIGTPPGNANARAISVQAQDQKLQLQLPWRLNAGESMVIGATTQAGNSPLDETETGIVTRP